ncbi:uncharacterized protein LOC108740244 [Agrilus planipennis]|uniref:Uncharacterized protein LOC108740244 n=1 Tax=Agrilus planipennis TaxID=224129 RepID=A0A1W4X1J3_AGRPL|nr:uncharacterized protein LOC108740244 [Agrilus planipennis]
MRNNGCTPTHSDLCLFMYRDGLTFVLIYADDLIVVTKDQRREKQFIDAVFKSFKLKNLGQVSYCLAPTTLRLLLHDPTFDVDDTNEERPYQELIEALMHLAVVTRFDIANAVSVLSQFNKNQFNAHWIVARILWYLRGTIWVWANCTKDRRSYTGYCFLLSGAGGTWEVLS